MEITDLMLNDYVMIHCFDGSDIVIKVTRVEGESGTVYGISKQGSHWANIEDVKPIPLTPEILEKNGFVNNEGWDEFVHYSDYPFIDFTLQVDEDGFCLDLPNARIAYVHELQHALKLFKIKKEIVL